MSTYEFLGERGHVGAKLMRCLAVSKSCKHRRSRSATSKYALLLCLGLLVSAAGCGMFRPFQAVEEVEIEADTGCKRPRDKVGVSTTEIKLVGFRLRKLAT